MGQDQNWLIPGWSRLRRLLSRRRQNLHQDYSQNRSNPSTEQGEKGLFFHQTCSDTFWPQTLHRFSKRPSSARLSRHIADILQIQNKVLQKRPTLSSLYSEANWLGQHQTNGWGAREVPQNLWCQLFGRERLRWGQSGDQELLRERQHRHGSGYRRQDFHYW